MYNHFDEESRMSGSFRDWRKALRTPATYRVGNAVRIQAQFVLLIIVIGVCLLMLFYYNWLQTTQGHTPTLWMSTIRSYNKTYPLTLPFVSEDLVTFRIAIVADLDKNSKSNTDKNTYYSFLKKGYLSYNRVKDHVSISWDAHRPVMLTSTYSHKGRGMELSELIVYDGRLLTFDDRSGMVFEIIDNKIVPWVILSDGNGHVEKGFKSEWATVKDDILYVGSMGKEWTTAAGDFENFNPMWVKAINIYGEVQHLPWVNQYKSIRSSIGIHWPGYMIHESGVWSPHNQMWYFLPRRCSHESYNETKDELMGCNYMMMADSNFNYIKAKEATLMCMYV
ncbi:hypothetical protein O3G_MSEX006456 [Manduca sexta]|uniref:Soluble calcium-activated nucleotidase 1 n=1 Tax=Manduca sexta TaxID=7130 RepID=A0A922CLD2_MANSE|nr:hypothetical protein O3G_MSEX006456 [Manduca sexta]